jgi:hypothetical protein
MSWQLQLLLLGSATVALLVVIFLSPRTVHWSISRKCLLSIFIVAGVVSISWGPIKAQYVRESRLDQDKSTLDLIAKFQSHDETVQKLIDHYAQMKNAESIFEFYTGRTDAQQRDDIDKQQADDLTGVLNNYEAIATPVGNGLRIRLGHNMFRVLFPVPMHAVPQLSFTGLPQGTKATVADASNIWFTVVFTPMSIAVEHFGLSASADF